MKLLTAFTLTIVLLAAAAAGLQRSATVPTAQADFPAASISTDLVFQCHPDGTLITGFGWASSYQGLQWLDISTADDGFTSEYVTAGPLSFDQTGLAWYGLQTGTWYFARVNTLTPGGWFPSQTMHFYISEGCDGRPGSQPLLSAPSACPLAIDGLAGCVWTERPDYATYYIGETVNYCYHVSQPTDLRIVVSKPDRTSLVVIDGYVNGTGACIGPFMANDPEGLRTVRMYGGPHRTLLSETHFYVDD